MAKFNRVTVLEPWGYDRLYPILQDAYRVLHISYQDLIKEKQKTPYQKPKNAKHWFLEDEITRNLVKNEEKLPKKFEYRIVNQQEDGIKKSRIDIAIQWSLTYGHSFDIKVECKLLHKDNLSYYVTDGIQKFKTNLYGEKLSLGGMLAYNTKDTIEENVNQLNTNITRKIGANETLKPCNSIDNYSFTYKSTHQREAPNLNQAIDLYTMVFDFKEVIS